MQQVIIIGAAGGIGSALVPCLQELGLRLVLVGRNEQPLTELAQGSDLVRVADARDGGALSSVVAEAVAEGPVVGMVNLAGSILLKPAHRTSSAEYESVIGTNLTTAFNTVAAAGQHLRDANVVLFSTAAAGHGFANHEAIAAAKGGVEALTRSAAATYAKKNLRINAVAPGLVDTPLSSFLTQSPPAAAASTKMHALGRLGVPDDVAGLTALLLNPATSWITGQVLNVDGGLGRVQAG